MSSLWFSCINSEEKDDKEKPFISSGSRKIPLFGKPRVVGCFSIDANRKFHFDNRQMRYLVSPLVKSGLDLDLNIGFGRDIFRRYVAAEKMHEMLTWIINERNTETSSSKNHAKLDIDFVTLRGTLKSIMCTPYFKKPYSKEWEICASMYKNIIYFNAIDTDTDIKKEENASTQQKIQQSWGYKFEQYMTTDEIGGKIDLVSRTHQQEEFCIVLQNVLNKHSLLYKAEIDAVVPHCWPGPESGDTHCYTELKCRKQITTEGHYIHFCRYILPQWWAQSHLVHIPEVICGLRNDNGIVKELEILRVSDMPQKGFGLWLPDVCLNFCDKFLNYLKKVCVEDDPNVVYKFSFSGDELILCKKLVYPEPRYRVIPEWYVEHMTQ